MKPASQHGMNGRVDTMVDGVPNPKRLAEESSVLVVSENVTSAAEVGGRVYECYCFNTTSCRSFKIGGQKACMCMYMYIHVK